MFAGCADDLAGYRNTSITVPSGSSHIREQSTSTRSHLVEWRSATTAERGHSATEPPQCRARNHRSRKRAAPSQTAASMAALTIDTASI
jgi:hypothetical protein